MKNNWRQIFHLEPRSGWMNDPNGLCFYNGVYHVFFQYSPQTPDGSNTKCWGHFTSPDLLEWTLHKTAVNPDTEYDRNGVYSGCAVIQNDEMHLFYTGNVKLPGSHDYITSGRTANVIHLIYDQDSSTKKVVLTNSNYPPFCSCHVRDPKVWYENGKYHMVLGARTLEDKGCVLFYSSDDLSEWKYENILTKDNFGYMWECPDYFSIDGLNFMSISPQGLEHFKYTNQNVYQSGWFTVTHHNGKTQTGDFHEWDMGFDFYAPQTFTDAYGRRILIGWMGLPDITYTNPTVESGWQHCLTVPREITCDKNGGLLANPVKELTSLRDTCRDLKDGDCTETDLPFELLASPDSDFEILIDNGLKISFESISETFSLQFLNTALGSGRKTRNCKIKKCSDIRILADMSSVEIYLNGGQSVMSTRIYPDNTSVTLSIKNTAASVWSLKKEVSKDE